MNRISYSQYRTWTKCPFMWSKVYVDKIKEDFPSIELVFGTAMHETIQLYLTGLYSNGASFADQINTKEILREEMGKEYNKSRKFLEEVHVDKTLTEEEQKKQLSELSETYISKKDMIELYYDGEKILEWFKKHRREFFNSVEEELVAIEFPLEKELRDNLSFIAYLDIVLRNKKTGKLRIIDLKTSKKGWNSYKKNDNTTKDQLVLYKAFYSSRYNVDVSKIDVEFIILKRKLYEDIPYKQKRILKFVPASGKPTIKQTLSRFDDFINSCFDKNGNMKEDAIFPKIATPNNCRYCPFNDRPEICDKKN